MGKKKSKEYLDEYKYPPNRDVKMRKCLKCGIMFKSEWSGRRRCPRCKNLTDIMMRFHEDTSRWSF
jgi:hypothetical protein